MDWQLAVVALVVAAAAAYVGRRVWHAWSGSCGGCGGSRTAAAGRPVTLISAEQLTQRLREPRPEAAPGRDDPGGPSPS